MKVKRALLIAFTLVLMPLLVLSATNPRWISPISINVSPALLVDGKLVTFSATLKVKRGPVDDLKVVVRLDGTKIWGHTYSHLDQDAEETVSRRLPVERPLLHRQSKSILPIQCQAENMGADLYKY